MEGKTDAKGSAAENTLLRAIRARRDQILQTAGQNHILTMAVLRTRLLLPEEGITSKVIKGGDDSLRLVKATEAGSLGGATAPPIIDGGHPARGTLWIASPVRGVSTCRGSASISSHPWPARAGIRNVVDTNGIPAGFEDSAGHGEKRASKPPTASCKLCGT